MQDNSKLEELVESLKRYLNTNYELHKLEAIERSSVIGSGIVSGLLIGLVGLFFIFFISIAAGFGLSSLFSINFLGFAVVAGFYLVLGLVLVMNRKKFVQWPLRDKIIREVFSKN